MCEEIKSLSHNTEKHFQATLKYKNKTLKLLGKNVLEIMIFKMKCKQ